MNTPRLLLDLQDVDALMVYVRECRRHNDDAALRALGHRMLEAGSRLTLWPEDGIAWLKGQYERCLIVGNIEIPFLWDHRRAVALTCDVADLVLSLFGSSYPKWSRPSVAVKTARAWLRDEASVNDCNVAAYVANHDHAAAAAAGSVATVAAYAAYAAASNPDAALIYVINAIHHAADTFAAYTKFKSSILTAAWEVFRAQFIREQVTPLIAHYALAGEV